MLNHTELPGNAPQTGTYRHYKGKLYQVFGLAQHSETDEWMVIYQALYGQYGFWVRPLSVWLSPVTSEASGMLSDSAGNAESAASGVQVQRFELVTSSSDSMTQLTKKPSESEK